MKQSLKFFAFLMITTFVIEGCNKYKDGPSFSLRTKKARITNIWTVEKILDPSGNDITQFYMPFYPDYSLNINAASQYEEKWSSGSVEGSWEWRDNKQGLLIRDPNSNGIFKEGCTILRLTSKEFWVQGFQSSNEFHFIPK